MGLSYPLNILKGFASSRLPLVVFTLCVMAFALTTLSLAYFIKNSDSVPNPDATILIINNSLLSLDLPKPQIVFLDLPLLKMVYLDLHVPKKHSLGQQQPNGDE